MLGNVWPVGVRYCSSIKLQTGFTIVLNFVSFCREAIFFNEWEWIEGSEVHKLARNN